MVKEGGSSSSGPSFRGRPSRGRGRGGFGKQLGRGAPRSENIALAVRSEFRQIAQEVEEYGASGLHQRSKKLWEKDQKKQQGFQTKNQKIPYNILVGMRKKNKMREDRVMERAREAGLPMPKRSLLFNDNTSHKGGKQAVAANKHRKNGDQPNIFAGGVGKLKGGVLHLTRADRNKVMKSGPAPISLAAAMKSGKARGRRPPR